MAMQPMAMYGLEVPCGDVAMIAHGDIPASFRVTMAAIDPTAEAEGEEDQVPRATLKVLRLPLDADEESDSEDGLDDLAIEDMEREFGDSEDSDSDDEGVNGGPSDPAKSKKAQREAAQNEIKKLLEEEGMDMSDDEVPNGVNGIIKSKKAKGKMPASDSDEEDSEDELDPEDLGAEIEEFVICTLDPNKNYQQPLDITIGEDERVWFKVSGTHTIYLTGNYVEPVGKGSPLYDPDSDEDDDEYDLSPDEDELDESEDESIDELDDLEDPRVTELEEDEEVPALIKTTKIEVKPKNKRPAPESADEDEDEAGLGAETLDEMISKTIQPAVNGDQKLSKKQLKKLKKNDGAAASAPVVETKVVEEKKQTDPPSSQSKKVSFAKELEQGPTPTKDKATSNNDSKAPKASLGVKTVQGVKIDDRKIGSGQAAKKGDRVSMRYIGKLESDGKIFDSNKGGKPFSFKLGTGTVIEGWEIGVKGMQAGGERRITVPANLAYKNKSMPGIPANSTLIFDIKLLDIGKN